MMHADYASNKIMFKVNKDNFLEIFLRIDVIQKLTKITSEDGH